MSEPTAERFILHMGEPPDRDSGIDELCALDRVQVLDRGLDMVRVQGDRQDLERFVDRHPTWELFAEVQYSIPEQRPVPRSRS